MTTLGSAGRNFSLTPNRDHVYLDGDLIFRTDQQVTMGRRPGGTGHPLPSDLRPRSADPTAGAVTQLGPMATRPREQRVDVVVRRHRTLGEWIAPFALALIVAAIAGACGGGSPSEDLGGPTNGTHADETVVSSDPPNSTVATDPVGATTSVTDPVDPAQQEIIDSYVAYWDARFKANSGVPNPQDPALAQFATGRQLDAVIAETQGNLDAGRALRAAANPVNFRRVTVVSVDGDKAVIQECFVDDAVVIERDTGAVINDAVATHNVQADLVRIDGQWRVSAATLIQRWEGVSGCALAS
jgi:hypothetical protein